MILVVEDATAVRGAIAAALREDGHEVVEMTDGMRLLAHLTSLVALRHQRRESLCIVAQPRASVCEVLQMLHAARWPTPVVLVGDEEPPSPGIGAVATLGAPVDLEELRAVVLEVARPARPETLPRGGPDASV